MSHRKHGLRRWPIDVEVKVTNKTGHRFPSGVGFRRAFLELSVLDQHDLVVWASGRTNGVGVIVDETGARCPPNS